MLTRKAGVGAGLHVGLAEEAGRAAVWLCRNGIDGVAVMAEAMASLPQDVKTGNADRGFCALLDGPSFIDQIVERGEGTGVSLNDVAGTAILFGLAQVAAEEFMICFEVWIDGHSVMLPASNLGGSTLPVSCKLFEIRHLGEGQSIEQGRPPSKRLQIRDEAWSRLEEMAARTYVPASETSRLLGAGAGLTDND